MKVLLRPAAAEAVAVRLSYKSQTKCEADAMERGRCLTSLAKGWQLFWSNREACIQQLAMKGRTVLKAGLFASSLKVLTTQTNMEKVSSAIAVATDLPVPLSGNPPTLRNAFQHLSREVIRPNDPQDQQEESKWQKESRKSIV